MERFLAKAQGHGWSTSYGTGRYLILWYGQGYDQWDSNFGSHTNIAVCCNTMVLTDSIEQNALNWPLAVCMRLCLALARGRVCALGRSIVQSGWFCCDCQICFLNQYLHIQWEMFHKESTISLCLPETPAPRHLPPCHVTVPLSSKRLRRLLPNSYGYHISMYTLFFPSQK